MGAAGGTGGTWRRSGRTWLGALGVGVLAASLGWLAGPLGLGLAAVIAVCWYLLPGAYVAAVGHLVVLPLLADPSVNVLLAVETGFVAVAAAPFVQEREWPVGAGTTAVAASVLGAVAWLGWRAWEPRWLAALAVVGLVAVGLYGLHRYAVVLLELQGVERAR